jgi:RNA polymerase sigma factor (sigma-70 family)
MDAAPSAGKGYLPQRSRLRGRMKGGRNPFRFAIALGTLELSHVPLERRQKAVRAQMTREDFTTDDRGMENALRFRSSLLRFFERRVRDRVEAEDLVQDVYVRLAQRGNLDDIEHLGGYVFEAAASVLRDRARRRQTRAADAHDPYDSERHGDVDFAPDRVLEGQVRLRQASAALLELPERTRHVFVLRRVEGLRYQDIAARLQISVSAVEKHMQRAVAFLLQRVDGA